MSKKSWQGILRFAVAILVMFILSLHVGKIEEIGQALLDIRISFVILTFLLMLLNIYVQYKKWLYILRIYYDDISWLDVFGSILGGFTLGLITPGRLGELGRGLFLRHLDKWHVTGLTLLDKTFSNLAVFFTGCLAFYYLFKYPFNLSIYVLVPFSIIVITIWIFLFFIFQNPQKIYFTLRNLEERFSLVKKLDPFIQSLEKIEKKNIQIIFFYSLVFYGIVFLQFLILVEAFSSYAILPTLSGIIATMFSKTLLPISFGDLGIREGAAIYFLNKVNVLKIHAFNASLLLFVINILIPSVVGIFLIPRLSIFNNKRSEK